MTSGAGNHTTHGSRVLFVDDEPLILRSIQRALGGIQGLSLCFESSGEAALRKLERERFDIVVSDMHMPQMDGATLLSLVQDRCPETVRIVLSGHADPKLVYRTVPVAHQALPKPFEPRHLAATLDRALALSDLLKSDKLRRLVGSDSKLPAPPATYTQLTHLLSQPDCSLGAIAEIIQRDVALSARVAQLASSAYFGVPRGVSTLLGYVTYLGVDAIKILVLSIEIGKLFAHAGNLPGFSIDAVERHSIATASLSREMAKKHEAEDAFLAGMLHDVGQLVLAARLTQPYLECLNRCAREGVDLCTTEADELGADHPAVGAYLLGLWGLPQPVVEAVASHHAPDASKPNASLDVIIYAANLLARDPEVPAEHNPVDRQRVIDLGLLEHIDACDRLDGWRAIARRVHQHAR